MVFMFFFQNMFQNKSGWDSGKMEVWPEEVAG